MNCEEVKLLEIICLISNCHRVECDKKPPLPNYAYKCEYFKGKEVSVCLIKEEYLKLVL